jgi:hypothetical protein
MYRYTHGIYEDMYLIISYNREDSGCLLAQYPYSPKAADQFNAKTNMDLSVEGLLWYARPQLFFTYTVAPVGSNCTVTPMSPSN